MGSLYDWRYPGFVLVCAKATSFNLMGAPSEGELSPMRTVETWYWSPRSLGTATIMQSGLEPNFVIAIKRLWPSSRDTPTCAPLILQGKVFGSCQKVPIFATPSILYTPNTHRVGRTIGEAQHAMVIIPES